MSNRRLDLLRHGEASGAHWRGRLDDPLTELGWSQMRSATHNNPGWSRIISSPLQRCALFAAELGRLHKLPLCYDDRLLERDFGDWEGRAWQDIPEAQLKAFWLDPAGYDPPGAEPFTIFRSRVLSLWRELRAGSDSHPLLVTHGGIIRVLVADVLRMPPAALLRIQVPLACHTRLSIPAPPRVPRLIRHGMTP